MNILAIGDVVSQEGCNCLRRHLPAVKKRYAVDFVIVNGENSAVGNGILPSSAEHLFDSGADVITTGNHAFRRRESYDYFDTHPALIRPANFSTACPGNGFYIADLGRYQVCVINLMGQSYLQVPHSPFDTVDALLQTIDCKIIVVDFHAEATGEKIALAHYLDGRVSAVFGTHTHVQTADEQILPGGTGYLTDVGMTGPVGSALGVEVQNVIAMLRTNLPTRFTISQNPCALNGVLFTIDETTGRCSGVQRLILS